MNTRNRAAIVIAAIFAVLVSLASTPTADAATSSDSRLSVGFGCATATKAGQLHCFGRIRAHKASNGKIAPLTVTSPTGLLPADLQSAYKVAGLSGAGRTVAIVDAQDDPNAEADLAHYRSQ